MPINAPFSSSMSLIYNIDIFLLLTRKLSRKMWEWASDPTKQREYIFVFAQVVLQFL
jgi:hypothetical protein